MTRRLHTAFSTSAVKYACVTIQGPPRGAPETGGVTRIRRGNRPPRDAPRPPRRHRGPVRPVSAVCARFPRVRASNASCNGVVGCGATGEVAGSAARARGSATRTSRRSPLPEPAGRAGKEPGGGVPPRGPVERRRRSAIISHRRSGCAPVDEQVAKRSSACGARRGGRFASRSVFFRPARAHRRSGAQRRTPRSRPIAIAPDAVQCAYKSRHGAPLQYLRRRPRGPLASCRPSCMPSRLSSSMARSDLILLDFG